MDVSATQPQIQLGDYIVIQRQKYTKLQKFSNIDTTTLLGKEQLELGGILNKPYSATFKMCPKSRIENNRGNSHQRLHMLLMCSDAELRNIREVLGISASGKDNRNICDDGDSQTLGAQQIEQLREECSGSTKIIENIIKNSRTFHAKTEYSQEKYLKKKEKKYFEYVQIHRPSIRSIIEIYYRQDADKIMGMRFDTLSQLISYAGVNAFGNYLLYESGTNGLLPASFLNSMGAKTEAQLVHMHPGNVPQKQAMLALNLPDEQMLRCISVNIYSVLREFYQNENEIHFNFTENEHEQKTKLESYIKEPINKKPKLDNGLTENTIISLDALPKPLKWQLENNRACAVMHSKFDSLVIAAKEHPTNIVNALLPFVKPSRPIVVYSLCKEVLLELYVNLKTNSNVTNLHLTSNWLRMYQVLRNRTHPEVSMSGNRGYMLCGYTVN